MNDLPGISYNSIGINGAGLYTYLDNEYFLRDLKLSPPDYFAFSVGTNDGFVPFSDFKPEVYKGKLEKNDGSRFTGEPSMCDFIDRSK